MDDTHDKLTKAYLEYYKANEAWEIRKSESSTMRTGPVVGVAMSQASVVDGDPYDDDTVDGYTGDDDDDDDGCRLRVRCCRPFIVIV